MKRSAILVSSATLAALSACAHEVARETPTAPIDAVPAPVPEQASPSVEPPVAADPPAPPNASACNEQPPQGALIRANYAYRADLSPEERAGRKLLHRAAIEYRTRRYGYVRGFGDPAWNRHAPAHYARETTFFGIKVRMNERVVPALRCVEAEIRRACDAAPYAPRILDGLRYRNTFYDGEVTNHAYGIALDIDPDRNSCCGCLPPLDSWPRCRRPSATPYDRARIPRCWVESFEKYGFYWLGHDPIEDTMHFEFLGDPDKIAKGLPTAEK